MFQQNRFTLILTLIGIVCSAHLGFAATIPLTQFINPSPINLLSANITTVGAQINTRLTIKTTLLDIVVEGTDCMMNAIIARGNRARDNSQFTIYKTH